MTSGRTSSRQSGMGLDTLGREFPKNGLEASTETRRGDGVFRTWDAGRHWPCFDGRWAASEGS